MNADHAFYIGNTHTVCQDFALSNTVGDDGAYAIVCDGCSQSPDADFGARALAFSAKRTLGIGGVDMKADLFGQITIDNLRTIGNMFPLHPKSLDATLLALWVKEKTFTVNMYGDGIFFHKTATTLRIVHVEYESNTPAYLSYYLDKLRLKSYEDTVFGVKWVSDFSIYLNAPNEIIRVDESQRPFEATTYKGLVESGDILGICSDGVGSFTGADGSSIRWLDVVKDFIDFKSTNGVYVQRRLGFLKRQFQKNKITFYDDISMASIIV